ncbi:MAG: hypothetical protein R2864_08460 [Syntrophotaleaceae bacterium]
MVRLNNARIARLLEAPILMVTDAGIGRVIDNVHLNSFAPAEKADLRMLLINKLLSAKRQETMGYLQQAFSDMPFKVVPGFDFSPVYQPNP